MLQALSTTLKAILDAASAPAPVSDADVSFDRPSDTFNPQNTTVNLFLYDIRENTELRCNEPVVERLNGLVTLRQPPLRVACSYLVTVWIASGEVGEASILKQHQLLAEVLRVFAGQPTIPPALLSGTPLASQPYPITLVTLQSELMRNPAEFWSALGGKLRPSFTLTATIAIDALTTPVSAKPVSSTTFTIEDATSGANVTLHQIGGTVRSAGNRTPVPEVVVSIEALGLRTLTDAEGRFFFGGMDAGTATVKFAKAGYTTVTRSMPVPGVAPTAFDVDLSLAP
ncbi:MULTISPECIES: Pvc16 family protein [unclassified Cyanobium]|uniref:Pvc16 family protein n=1 Tax=unclassified Cyanobium TaxID=2627006 RepID=UPI0020CCF542|nr:MULTISPECIES: Pvc16 family protein [unclassified Cyanobium]MCP9835691.1 DUF4255 domain-containing protein [Cyanobium sp. La Preciosa 7G6]MCP9938484.1 DUF4255 domain-containing protein [Cyanobium sp. Aljojuca 7A6]